MIVKDCNGNLLEDGDSIKVIKDLKVKGTSSTIKRGTIVKSIRTTSNDEEIDCRIKKAGIVLKTCYVQKVSN